MVPIGVNSTTRRAFNYLFTWLSMMGKHSYFALGLVFLHVIKQTCFKTMQLTPTNTNFTVTRIKRNAVGKLGWWISKVFPLLQMAAQLSPYTGEVDFAVKMWYQLEWWWQVAENLLWVTLKVLWTCYLQKWITKALHGHSFWMITTTFLQYLVKEDGQIVVTWSLALFSIFCGLQLPYLHGSWLAQKLF